MEKLKSTYENFKTDFIMLAIGMRNFTIIIVIIVVAIIMIITVHYF